MTQAADNSGAMPAVAPMHVPANDAFARFPNFAEWWHSTGDVPLERIVNDPPPGTATEQDLLRLVEGDRLVELIDGTLVEKPVGSTESLIALNLAFALMSFVRPRKLGVVYGPDATLKMKSGRVRLPDVTFVSREDLPGGVVPKISVPTITPTIAAEVISEANTDREMKQKAKEYFESGSKLVWMIYPKTRTVAVFEQLQDEPTRTLTEAEILDGGAVLPGFQMKVADLFVTSL
jgi:Uma2 family endonuclease